MGGPVRPSGYIGWGSTGATNVTEPTDSQKAAGWSTNQAPPSSYVNWIQQKQDQWIQYLDWRQQAFTVVEENSLPNPGPYGVTGSTQGGAINIGPWQYYTPSQADSSIAQGSNWDVYTAFEGDNTTPMGRQFFAIGSGYAHILATIGSIGNTRDFRMDHVMQFTARPNSTGYAIEAGVMYNHSGVSGANPVVGWVATGRTGQLFAQWIPSGKSATCMACPSAYQQTISSWIYPVKLTIESRGATLAFYANDVLQGSVASVPLGAGGTQQQMFGTRAGGASGAMALVNNSMRFQIVRTPY